MRRGKYIIYYIRIYISANIVSISAPSAERIIISAIISNLSSSTGGERVAIVALASHAAFRAASTFAPAALRRLGTVRRRIGTIAPPLLAAPLSPRASASLWRSLSPFRAFLASSFSVYAGIPISSRDPLSSAKVNELLSAASRVVRPAAARLAEQGTQSGDEVAAAVMAVHRAHYLRYLCHRRRIHGEALVVVVFDPAPAPMSRAGCAPRRREPSCRRRLKRRVCRRCCP